jgi:hypothetical protein
MVMIDVFLRQLFVSQFIPMHNDRPNSVGEHDAADRCPRATPNYSLQLNQ